jgi:molybdopterin/thiamine biosynthesis adenylyltransferase
VGVIGAGGAGSLINEYLSHLGVGQVVFIDPDLIEPPNLPRVVGARRRDTRPWLTHRRLPTWLRRRGERLRTSKVAIAQRVAAKANPQGQFIGIVDDVTAAGVADQLRDCDYLFLAADSMQARLVFNALIHQYLIPGVEMGAKAQVDQDTGDVVDLFVSVRPLIPGVGCLWCNGLISPSRLQEEATSVEQRRRQRYVDDDDVPAPSVITLNAIGASLATNDFLMTVTGLLDSQPLRWTKIYPRSTDCVKEIPRTGTGCRECSATGRRGRGPSARLPVKAE